MSRTRIVGGKYTKHTKETHYMFSDENISTFSEKKIHEDGKKDGILIKDAKKYEPWKNHNKFKMTYTFLASTINEKLPLDELGIKLNVKTCITHINLLLKVEAQDETLKDTYYLNNWLYNVSILMNNRGEIARGNINLYEYKCDNTVMIGRQSGFSDKLKRKYKDIRVSNFPLANKGGKLHDEIFLEKSLSLKSGATYRMDYEGSMGEEDFYNKLAAFLVEASKVNRTFDVSYAFLLAKKPKAYLEKMKDYANIGISCPLLDKAIDKFAGLSLLKKTFGFLNYTLSLNDFANQYQSVEGIRGPVQMDEVQMIHYEKNPDTKEVTKSYAKTSLDEITTDTEALAKILLKKTPKNQN